MSICEYCQTPDATLRCTGCRNAHYCSRDHQRLDWNNGHRGRCRLTQGSTTHRRTYTEAEVRHGESLMKGWNTISNVSEMICILNELSSMRVWPPEKLEMIDMLLRDGWGVALDYYFITLARHPAYTRHVGHDTPQDNGPPTSLQELSAHYRRN